jgi:ATP-dependent DNA ligase
MFVKDFFDLDGSRERRQLEFVFRTYIKAMNHKNDGVIFNKKWNAPYKIGKNEGYLKWKPPHLNTIDFLLVPNTKYEDRHENEQTQVVDLYLHENDQ